MVNNIQRFTNEERLTLDITSQEAFETYWTATLNQKAGFDKNHEKGVAGAGKKANNQLASAYQIAQNFSPVMEMVKNFGAPFGGMALGTLCFVLVVRLWH